MAVDDGDGGRLAVGKLDGEAQGEARAGKAQLMQAHLVEDASAIAEQSGDGRYGIPDDIAEAAQSGEGGVDRCPSRNGGRGPLGCRWRGGDGRWAQ